MFRYIFKTFNFNNKIYSKTHNVSVGEKQNFIAEHHEARLAEYQDVEITYQTLKSSYSWEHEITANRF